LKSPNTYVDCIFDGGFEGWLTAGWPTAGWDTAGWLAGWPDTNKLSLYF